MPIAISAPLFVVLLSLGSQIKNPYNTLDPYQDDTVLEALEEWKQPENECVDLSGAYHCPQNTKIQIHQNVSSGGHIFAIFPAQIFEDISDQNHESPEQNLMYGNFIADGKKIHSHPYFENIQYIAQCTPQRLNIVMISKGKASRFLQFEYRTQHHGSRAENQQQLSIQKQRPIGASSKNPLNITHCIRTGEAPPRKERYQATRRYIPQRF